MYHSYISLYRSLPPSLPQPPNPDPSFPMYSCSVDERDEVVVHWTEDGSQHSKSLNELARGALNGDQQDQNNLEYFHAQLDLFSNMCLERQYLAILKVKERLPIDVVLRWVLPSIHG